MKKALLFMVMVCSTLLSYSQATDLIISEYAEGTSGNSKYVEIYNGTGATVSLANYQLWRVTNGGTWPEATYSFTAINIADGATLVVAHNNTDVPGADEYDTGFCAWNGDDAVGLAKSGALIDVIGTDGADPGSGWDVAGTTNATANGMLTRKSTICSPNTNWTTSAGTNATDSEWIVGAYSTGSANAGHTASCAPSCTPATINTVSPVSGPVGTHVTITASSGDLSGATATIGGTAATVVSSSASQLVLQVPSGATSGDIVITDSQPCDVTYSTFTVIDIDNTSCDFVAAFSDLFISEVTDASSGSLSYIEIFNATGATVNMTDYEVQIRNNGNPTGTDITLTGTLAHGDSFILATAVGSGCGVPGGNAEYADQTDVSSGVNNNDCIHLANLGTVIDTWGVCDGSNWINAAGLGSAGYDFQRKASATAPNTTFALADWTIVDYDSCDDNYTNIETYVGINPTPVINTQPSLSLAPCDIATSFTVGASEGLAGGQGLAYQWYVSAPGDAGWTALTDTGVYTGSTTDTLNISSVIGLDNYQYYCQVRENGAACYTASETVVMSSTISSIWNGTVWSAAPTNTRVVVIDADYDTAVNGSFDACSLIVNTGVTLDIKAGDYVNVVNDLTVNGDVQVRHEGSFVQENDLGSVTLGASGNVDVHKTTTPMLNWWSYTFWSSPVIDDTVGSALATSHPIRRHVFLPANFNDANADGADDNGDDWRHAPVGETMTPGIGYVACGQTTATYPGHQQNVKFNGAFNNGVITTPVSMAASPDPWNILGNPYASAIDSHAFVSANAGVVDNTFYLWTHNSQPIVHTGPYVYDFTTDDYATYNTVMGSGTAATSGGAVPSRYIASGQSFLIRGVSATNATFNNSMRVKTNNDAFFRSAASVQSSSSQRDMVWLNLSNDYGAFNQILIGFVDGASNNIDAYDSKKRLSPNVSFYSIVEGEGYTINGRQALVDTQEIPLGFVSKVTGAYNYTIEIDHTEGNFTDYDIFLEDKELNVLHDLRLGQYEVVLDQGEYEDRFALVLQRKELMDVEDLDVIEDSVVIYQNNDVLEVISSIKNIKKVGLFDVLGKRVFSQELLDKTFTISTSNLSDSMYIVKVELDNNQAITKKFVKR